MSMLLSSALSRLTSTLESESEDESEDESEESEEESEDEESEESEFLLMSSDPPPVVLTDTPLESTVTAPLPPEMLTADSRYCHTCSLLSIHGCIYRIAA